MTINDIIRRAGQLPASQIVLPVNEKLEDHNTLVITAPPGAGKSTLLPLTIHAARPGGRILMLEPRRLAARQIAERMASTLGEPVGKTVGYRVRFESKVSADTRIEVLTEGILTRMLVDDATLEGVDAVIFDEFHERSIHSDLALALARQSQQIIRPDLKIIIMSATIETDEICQSLHAPLIESKGRMFPVKVTHAAEDTAVREMPRAAAQAIVKAHREEEGDILVFLPGQGEIEKCQELLGSSLAPTSVYPLYGNLAPELQRRAIAPSQPGERKVVLATPIAETSLTIEGVRIVIDSGLCRSQVFDIRTGMNHLETVRISMDMATQRTGRAGRVAEGCCHRLWTLASEHHMETQRKPEIAEADLAPMVLSVAAFGESDTESLPWLTPPPAGNMMKARQLLQTLGALDGQGIITLLGRRMAALPCHPRISRMIISAKGDKQQGLACDIAALLEEKDPMADSHDSDMTLRISALRAHRRKGSLARWARIARIAQEYRRLVFKGMKHEKDENEDIAPEEVGGLVAHAYPERIAKAADDIGHFRLASGGQVQVDHSDILSARKWLAIASLYTTGRSGRIFLAAPVDIDNLDETGNDAERQTGRLTTVCENVSWDSKQGCVVMQKERRIGLLVVSSKPIHDADKQQVKHIVCEAVKKDGLSMLDWNENVQRLQQRVGIVAAWHPELGLPDLSTQHLMDTACDWLPFYLEQDRHIRSNVAELKKIRLEEVLWALLTYEQQQAVDRLAPTHIEVPTGSRIRVDYRPGAAAPVLSVRLQECFGLLQTPCVNNGRQPVLMELLSPGFKPVQLTQDLHSFWQGTYFEVRKEMKRRYPKHYWPENPLEAEAVRGTRRKKPSGK